MSRPIQREKQLELAYFRLVERRSLAWCTERFRVSPRTAQYWVKAAMTYTDPAALILRGLVPTDRWPRRGPRPATPRHRRAPRAWDGPHLAGERKRGRPPLGDDWVDRKKHIKVAYYRLIERRSTTWCTKRFRVCRRTVNYWVTAAMNYTDPEALILQDLVRGGRGPELQPAEGGD